VSTGAIADPGRSTPRHRAGAADRPALRLVATFVAAISVAATGWVAYRIADAAAQADAGAWRWILLAAAIAGTAGATTVLLPLVRAFRGARAGRAAQAEGRVVEARRQHARARSAAWVTLGSSLAVLCMTAFALFLVASDHAVQSTFFAPHFIQISFAEVAKAFLKNVLIALSAQAIVLVWGLVLALAKLAPGPAGRPIARLATAYIDVFRAVPAIIVIYLVGFGLPLAEVPLLSGLNATSAAIFALSLIYGAYVAEVYRAGIDSIHRSQTAAARSLGLSYGQALRHVVVPQAVRRVIPPLLNDFISLQKDTALVTVIGTVEAFNQSKTYASNYFNLSSVTVVALLFIVCTIPQTRLAERLLDRDRRRMEVS
jgi:polar amino acid transport system permease protein